MERLDCTRPHNQDCRMVLAKPLACMHPPAVLVLLGQASWIQDPQTLPHCHSLSLPAGTPNAQINLDMEVYGSTIQPFNSTKASIIGQGIANLLADGTAASQISIQDQGNLAAVSSPASLH